MLAIRDNVRVKGTDIKTKVIAIGKCGLIKIELTPECSGFDRAVYSENELEKIGGNNNEI